MLITFLSIISFLIIITVIICVHELGHLFFSKKSNVYCFEYSMGIGPKIFSKKKGETIYTIRLFPIGGYVQIMDSSYTKDILCNGEKYSVVCTNEKCYLSGNEKDLYSELDRDKLRILDLRNVSYKLGNDNVQLIGFDSNNNVVKKKVERLVIYRGKDKLNVTGKNRDFYYLKFLNKVLILTSGVIANLILAFLLFFVSFSVSGIPSNNLIVEKDLIRANVVGEENILINGDKILESNGRVTNKIKDFVDTFYNNENIQHLNLVIERNNKIINVNRKIYERNENNSTYRYVGITFMRNYNLIDIVKFSFLYFLDTLNIILISLFNIFKGRIPISNLTGVVGIAKETKNILNNCNHFDISLVSSNLLMFSGLLSLNIGIMNIIPLPILDGGRVIIVFIEQILNKRLSSKIVYMINFLSIIILFGLFVYVTLLDVLRLRG